MLTIEELEAACGGTAPEEMPRHALEGPDLVIQGTVYPFGFPLEIRTNSDEVMRQYHEMWGSFERRHEISPIVVEVQVVETSSADCPPAPTYRLALPLMMDVADQDNYAIVDVVRSTARIVISQAALRHPLYAQYFLLGAPGCCVSARYVTPVHAACVELDGRGILLCGDSGAGKSTLAYACARGGWTYVSDDGSYLLNGGTKRLVTGDCYRVRFRPTAAEIFPELQGLELTPRAAGKASIELPTAPMKHIARAQTTRVDAIVFLNRRSQGPPALVPYSKEVARCYMRQTLFGTPEMRAVQHKAIEQLLAIGVHELRYSSLDWAIDRLRRLLQDGR